MNEKSLVYGVLLLSLFACCGYSLENFEEGNTSYVPIILRGQSRLISEHLLKKLQEEELTTHWLPWQRVRLQYEDNVVFEHEFRNSIDSFPESVFTDEQLRKGGFLLYFLFGVYAFTLLAVVCNDFFIPCVELICEDLKIPQHVAAATFMSVATSCPEFFVNMISTFLTESDMGIGTIVGSAIFNALGVGAIGSLAAVRPIPIGMRPVTRDVVIYMINVSLLVAIVWDGQIDWYEALALGVTYVCYFILMFNSTRLFDFYDKIVAKNRQPCDRDIVVVTSSGHDQEDGIENKGFNENHITVSPISNIEKISETEVPDKDEIPLKPVKSIFAYPKHKSWFYQVGWIYLWPLKRILGLTIPSPTHHRRWYPLSFIMCMAWIGVNSYFVTWSMTVLGHVFLIPDSVMGMTFLAFGGCVPEACSIFIMSRRGEGGIGVSNALGANSLAILFALGTPWLIKTLINISQGYEITAVLINSSGIDFVVGSLLVAVSILWIILFLSKFTLRKSVGYVLASMYLIFITFAILVEMGIILDRCLIEEC